MKTCKKRNVQNFTKLTQRGGISLIVLVITIIVIMILAAAVILTINNNNPIAEANNARYESDRANMQAVFTLAVGKVMTQNRATVSITAGQINTEVSGVKETTGTVSYTVTNAMNSNNSSGTIVFDKDTNTDTTFYTGKKLPIYAAGETKWYVDSEGNISLEVVGVKYGEGEIVKPPFSQTVADDVATYYGKKVLNYETGNDTIDNQVEWQIFYADTRNIYLIATDYIHADICPPSANNVIYEKSDYKLFMDNVIKDYNGSEDITDTRLQALNSSYHEYLTTNNAISENNNIKAVAYMLDTSDTVWGTFAGENADYAIGGPTVEMLMKSYSQKYSVDYRAKATSVIGYLISKDGGINWTAYSNMIDTSDTQYVISASDRKADAMWLASPSDSIPNFVLGVYYNGDVYTSDYINSFGDLGFRPLVCLNSNVSLKAVEGGYEIE